MITFSVNGAIAHLDVDPDTPLLWVIRENIGLTEPNSAVAWRCAAPVPYTLMAKRSARASLLYPGWPARKLPLWKDCHPTSATRYN